MAVCMIVTLDLKQSVKFYKDDDDMAVCMRSNKSGIVTQGREAIRAESLHFAQTDISINI